MRNLVIVMGLLLFASLGNAATDYSFSQCENIIYTEGGASAKEAADLCSSRKDVLFISCVTTEYNDLNKSLNFAAAVEVCQRRIAAPSLEQTQCAIRLTKVNFESSWAKTLCQWTTKSSIQNCILSNAVNAKADSQKEALISSCYQQEIRGELNDKGENLVELEKRRRAAEEKARQLREAQAREAARVAEEAKRKAAEEAQRKAAQEESQRKAAQEAKLQEAAKLKEEAQRQSAEEAKRKAAEEEKRKASEQKQKEADSKKKEETTKAKSSDTKQAPKATPAKPKAPSAEPSGPPLPEPVSSSSDEGVVVDLPLYE